MDSSVNKPIAAARFGQDESVLWKNLTCHRWPVCVLLALVTCSVFWPVYYADFVNYDDPDYVTSNPHVLKGLTLANLKWAFTTGHASNWHPLTWLSHMLDCQLFGQSSGPPHLVNLVFHTANVLLVFLVLRQMTAAHWRSAFVAALFALHPLHVESVAWVSERKDLVSALFFLLTMGAYARYGLSSAVPPSSQPAEQGKNKRPRPKKGSSERSLASPSAARPLAVEPSPPGLSRRREVETDCARPLSWYALALAFFALGLASKPMLVTLPFVLLLLDFWPLERIAFAGAQKPIVSLRRLLAEKIPFFLLAAVSSWVTFVVQRKGGAVSTVLSLSDRLGNAVVSYARYLGKTIWPRNLSVLYPHPGHWPPWQVAGSATLLVAISVVVVLLTRRRRYWAVGWLWFVGMLVPVIGLIQVGVQSMADRYSYLPAIGLFIMVGWGINDLLGRWRLSSGCAGLGAGLILVACALLTERQLRFWNNGGALFGHAVEVTDRNYLAYNNLGFYLAAHGKRDEAMENYKKSLAINPGYGDALNNMGYACAALKRYSEAIAYYEAALRAQSNNADIHNNFGNALSDTGRLNEAIEQYRMALQLDPEHADAHNGLGIALAMQGRLDEAVEQFRAALRLRSTYADAHDHLGNALALQRKFDAAMQEYQECRRLTPMNPRVYYNLANVLVEQGKLDEAVRNYELALRLNPNNPEAHSNLGAALARQGKQPEAHFHLGMALVLQGKMPEALAHFNEALRLKPDYTEARQQLELLNPSPPR